MNQTRDTEYGLTVLTKFRQLRQALPLSGSVFAAESLIQLPINPSLHTEAQETRLWRHSQVRAPKDVPSSRPHCTLGERQPIREGCVTLLVLSPRPSLRSVNPKNVIGHSPGFGL